MLGSGECWADSFLFTAAEAVRSMTAAVAEEVRDTVMYPGLRFSPLTHDPGPRGEGEGV